VKDGRAATVLLVGLPLLKLAIHLSVGAGWGYHKDEMYFLRCADHLDWGYVDHQPVSIVILAAVRSLAGDSVAAIRVVPALAGALMVALIGLITRRLGGGSPAMALAMGAAIAAPVYLALDGYYSMNALDLLVWAIATWMVVGMLEQSPDVPTRSWVALGLLLGVGLQNKLSVFWLGGGLIVGLLLTPQRSLVRSRGPWITLGLAFLIFIPQILWQIAHDFATLRWIVGSADGRIPTSAASFVEAQVEAMLGVAAPIWLAGLMFFLVLPRGRPFRALGLAWIAIFTLLAVSPATRPYYLAPTFIGLLPAGAVVLESLVRRSWAPWLAAAYLVVLAQRGLLSAVVVLPILPKATVAAYAASTGAGQRFIDRHEVGTMPEFLSHMSGWEEIVDQLAGVYEALPESERPRASMLIAYYPIAGAVDVLGRKKGLPRAAGSNNNYWLWGPPPSLEGPVITLGYSERQLREWYTDVVQATVVRCTYCNEEPHTVWVARGLRVNPAALWASIKYRD
jgi:4-amino-4-deoxy-L-arabinose transferase-like glycosyltransferase